MKTYLYVPAEGRVVLDEVESLPSAGAIFSFSGRDYRVTAVNEHGHRPAVLSLEAVLRQPPAAI